MDEIRAQSVQITVEKGAGLFFEQNKIRAIKPRKQMNRSPGLHPIPSSSKRRFVNSFIV